jgi:hypothetical protein
VCRFPANALIDVRSFAIKFDVTATCATSNSGTSVANNVIPPQHSSSFIERFELFANGSPLSLSGLSDYKSLAAIQQNLVAGGNKLTELSAFEGGSVATPTSTSTFGTRTYVISNFLGMLAGTHCRYIPLNALGQLELRWTLPPNSILSVFNAVNTGASYSISNVQCYVDAISFDDGLFDGMLRQQLASGQPLIIPMKNYSSFFGSTSSTTSNTTFQINTGSLDALYGTLRSQTYDAADSVYTPSLGTTPTFVFTSDGSSSLFQWQINSISYPTFAKDTTETYLLMKNAFDAQDTPLYTNAIGSKGTWEVSKFTDVLSLDMLGNSSEDHVSSGLNTSGTSVPITWKTQNGATGTGTRQTIFAETTAVLEVHSGQQVVLHL